MLNQTQLEEWVVNIQDGDRNALSKAITLIESQKPPDKLIAKELLNLIRAANNQSLRIGITGPPGVGKSTLIESLGLYCIEKGFSVAVLSIDPSSAITKGSILGDKTRMLKLSQQANAYIRPSPTGIHLGGVAQRTRESISLCEAAGFDFIFVETAGIGQSEYQVSTMTDLTVLMTLAGTGDELQGIKRGIMEWADILVIHKVDEDGDRNTLQAYNDLVAASHYAENRIPGNSRKILKISSLNHRGIDQLFDCIINLKALIEQDEYKQKYRIRQLREYFYDLLKIKLLDEILQKADIQEYLLETEKKLLGLDLSPEDAAEISRDFIFANFNAKQ